MALPPPMIPTRKPELDILTSSPGSSSTPSLFPPAHTQTASSSTAPTSSHSRFPSVSSDGEFGAFVSVDEGQDPLGTSNDLLSFSPVKELGNQMDNLTFTGTSGQSRDHPRRGGTVLAELLAQEEGELFGRVPTPASSGSTGPPTAPGVGPGGIQELGGRPIGHKRRQSSASSPTRPILSPPRRLSHMMAPQSQSPSASTASIPTTPFTSQEPSSMLSASSASIFHPTSSLQHTNAEDFFSPMVRKMSRDQRAHTQPEPSSSRLPSSRSHPDQLASSLRPSFPSTASSRRTPTSNSPTPSRSSSAISMPSSPSHASTPPPAQSSPSSSGVLPTLLKAGTRWTTLVSSALPISNTPAALTHTTPFHSAQPSSSSSYVPPSGAPGFRPGSAGWNTGGWDLPPDGSGGDDEVKLLGRRDGTLEVLTSSAAEMIRPHLPPRQRLASKWSLLYSLDQHGSSLGTLYHLTAKFADKRPDSGNVIVVRDSEGGLFGAFVNEAFKIKPGSYYGSGECFLFKFHPFPNSHPSATPGSATPPTPNLSTPSSGGFELFRWTGKNEYFVLCEASFLSVGGGDGKFGLYLDSALYAGSSARCPAFENEVLCSAAQGSRMGRFDCVGVEVWGMGE